MGRLNGMQKHSDAAGKDIKPGSYFVYATRIADRSHLQFGRVVELKGTADRAKIGAITAQLGFWPVKWEATGKGRVQTIERLDALLVVPLTTLHPAVVDAIAQPYKLAKAKLKIGKLPGPIPDPIHAMVEGNCSDEQC
jgi:hypothetical protein